MKLRQIKTPPIKGWSFVSVEAVRWGDSAVGGFADLKRLSSGSPTCSNCRSPEGFSESTRKGQ
ncbi:hypothetical protein [Nostoc parmelioides]|uniref:Uncharacterized protein n=1 Tax=Nostoc parmelioides FACHB-3921 TaxID=2692909 RepID=A0ABR8B883_9NOSO|nr:hypothetical protein [Nostoc parmelioides]MBD2250068.1 hypothetical protein [Nostoc parmelioides FACHB-3921]